MPLHRRCRDAPPGWLDCEDALCDTQLMARNILTSALHGSAVYAFDLRLGGWFGKPAAPVAKEVAKAAAKAASESSDNAAGAVGKATSAADEATSAVDKADRSADKATGAVNTHAGAVDKHAGAAGRTNAPLGKVESGSNINTTTTAAIWNASATARRTAERIFNMSMRAGRSIGGGTFLVDC